MKSEVNLKQIGIDAWQRGDFRPVADIYRTAEDLFEEYEANFSEYLEEGIGKVKSAFFETPNGRRFIVNEYLEPPFPLLIIFVLYDSETMMQDLDEIKELLDLNDSDLDFVYKY
jgi:hypothetical protein